MKVVEIKQWNIWASKVIEKNHFLLSMLFISGGHKWVLLSLSIQAIVQKVNLSCFYPEEAINRCQKNGKKTQKDGLKSTFFVQKK